MAAALRYSTESGVDAALSDEHTNLVEAPKSAPDGEVRFAEKASRPLKLASPRAKLFQRIGRSLRYPPHKPNILNRNMASFGSPIGM